MDPLIGQQLGQYEIRALLGKGGMANVYRAHQTSIQRDVAIKVMKSDLAESDDFVRRFAREAQTVARLSHPYIVKLFDYGQHDNMVYLVMELLTAGSLSDLIRTQRPPPDRIVALIDQIGQALDYAHGMDVIHRDLKPGNVLLDRQGNAFLTDFGIAKLLGADTTLTQNNVIMGTATYMSPEQWRGETLDSRADIYALGVMVFEMLTGRTPFVGESSTELMYKHLHEIPPRLQLFLPNTAHDLQGVLDTALAKNRADRYATAAALVNALRRALPAQQGTFVGNVTPVLSATDDTTSSDVVDPTNPRGALDESKPLISAENRISGTFPFEQLDLPLIGRSADVQAVRTLIAEQNRIVLLSGLGGIGKTHLAAALADSLSFRDGVIWHTIAPYSTIDDLTLLIRDHLNLGVAATADATWAELGKSQTLVVIDNAEDCTSSKAYADRLNRLNISNGARVLMTSRQQWPELRGVKSRELRAPDANAAIRILKAMIEQEPPAFSLEGAEDAIVQAAHYHPRLLQYAVRWANSYPAVYILEILKTLDGSDAEQALDDMVHRTVRQVQEKPGGAAAILALQRLTACRGGFDLEAARALNGAEFSPAHLGLLKQWGLLTITGGRYEIEPLVSAAVGVDESVYPVHFQYYKTFAEARVAKQDFGALLPESGNLDAAFEWAMASGNPDDGLALLNLIYNFLRGRGRFDDFIRWSEQLVAAFADRPDRTAWANALNRLGGAYYSVSVVRDREANLERAVDALEKALGVLSPEADPIAYGTSQNTLGAIYMGLAEVKDRAANLQQAINALSQAAKAWTPDINLVGYLRVQSNLGNAYRLLSEVEDKVVNLRRSIAVLEQAASHPEANTIPFDCAAVYNNLAISLYSLAETVTNRDESRRNLQQAIEAYQQTTLYWTLESAPLNFATVQSNLGITYGALVKLINEELQSSITQAFAAFGESERIFSAETYPLNYAVLHENQGDMHHILGNREAAIQHWQEAEKYYRVMDTTEAADRLHQQIAELQGAATR